MFETAMGIYQHYKGPLYQVIGLAHDANAGDYIYIEDGSANRAYSDTRHVVVYMPLELDGAHLGPRMAVRDIADWEAVVCTNKGHDHYGMVLTLTEDFDVEAMHDVAHRFTYLGATLTKEMFDGRKADISKKSISETDVADDGGGLGLE